MSYEQQLEQIRKDAETWPDWKRRECGLPPKSTTKPSGLFTKQLRDESRFCQTANGAAILQAVAAWMEGRDIFDPPAELWEHADRLCGGAQTRKDTTRGGMARTDEQLDQLADLIRRT